MKIEFGILGPLVVRREAGPVALGGGKPRALLAMLLLRPNEPVSPERLAAGLWGEDAPHGSVKTVQVALGHSTPTITLNTYVGLWPEQVDRTRTLVDAALGEVDEAAIAP